MREQYRGLGYGKALLQHLAQICVERGYPRLDWWVLDCGAGTLRGSPAAHGAAAALLLIFILASWWDAAVNGDGNTDLIWGVVIPGLASLILALQVIRLRTRTS